MIQMGLVATTCISIAPESINHKPRNIACAIKQLIFIKDADKQFIRLKYNISIYIYETMLLYVLLFITINKI